MKRFVYLLLASRPCRCSPTKAKITARPTAPAVQASVPRVAAISEEFELVGVVSGGNLVVYLDRFATNEPVAGATLELESGAVKAVGTAAPEPGTYALPLGALASPGKHALVFTVAVGNESDLLSGTLEIPGPPTEVHRTRLERMAGLGRGRLGVPGWNRLAVAASDDARRARALRRDHERTDDTYRCSLLAIQAAAHEGDDHSKDAGKTGPAPRTAAANAAEGPKRLADGSLFVPKAAQRQLGIRTSVGKMGDLAQTVELIGRVVTDPNAGGHVQSSQAGRIEAGPRGLPTLGQKVRKGEVLAYVRPVASSIERGNQQAALAELRANRALAEKKLARSPGAGRHRSAEGDRGREGRPAKPDRALGRGGCEPRQSRAARGARVGGDQRGHRGERPGGRGARGAVRDRRSAAADGGGARVRPGDRGDPRRRERRPAQRAGPPARAHRWRAADARAGAAGAVSDQAAACRRSRSASRSRWWRRRARRSRASPCRSRRS